MIYLIHYFFFLRGNNFWQKDAYTFYIISNLNLIIFLIKNYSISFNHTLTIFKL